MHVLSRTFALLLVTASLLTACGGGTQLILVNRPNNAAGRAQILAAGKALGCQERDSDDGTALMFWACPSHPSSTVLFMEMGNGWATNCANANQQECEALTANVLGAIK